MSLLILRGLLLASEALAISAALPLLSWITGLFLRRNAAQRHLVWLAAFGVLLALPLLALMAPPRMLLLQPAAPVPVDVAMAAPIAAAYAQSWSVESLIALAAAPLCVVWLLGLAWNLMRLALGAHGLVRMRRSSLAFDRIGNCDVRLGGGPLTFGFLKPIIILPQDAPHWPRARLDAVLKHELAHVARHDSATQWLAAIACAFYWPNPLVWLGARSLRRDAEMAADDRVLAAGVQPSVYAAELVRLAADARGARFAVAMATPSSLEARVTSVLSPTPSRAGVTPMDVLKLALLGGACAIALAFARPDIAMAQQPIAAPMRGAVAKPKVDRLHAVDVHVDADNGTVDAVSEGEKDGVVVKSHVHHTLSPQAREQLHQALEQAQAQREQALAQAEAAREQAHQLAEAAREQARAEGERAREQADAIRVDARASAQEWHKAEIEVHQALRQAMAEIRASVPRSLKDVEGVEAYKQKAYAAIARAQPQIDAAMARANVAVQVHVGAPPEPALPPVPAQPPAPPPPVP